MNYTYEIISVNQQAKCMEIVYRAEGRQPMHIGARLPFVNEPLENVVKQYAPIVMWEQEDLPLSIPTVGVTGWIGMEEKTLEDVKREKLEALAAWRYDLEVGGITLGSSIIRTDRESQALITGAFTTLKEGFVPYVDFKTASGAWIQITLAEITPIAQAVAQHVQTCFTAEKNLMARIHAAETIEDINNILFV